ncbi:MAG: glutamate-cysteine ligase family protein, partial [Planctomycetaceae bacterium]
LPFANDDEFGRLHAAIRLLLPILPALAASSPLCDERLTGLLDTRLDVYRSNARRVPSVSGQVVPEPVFTQQSYEQELLGKIYRDIAPLDPEGVLQHEWLNARGAIARFERNTIEIRVLDVQECPHADLAICEIVTAVLQQLIAERWQPIKRQQEISTDALASILLASIRDADNATIEDPAYLALFGWTNGARCTTRELWSHLRESSLPNDSVSSSSRQALDVILQQGSLSRRIANGLGANPSRDAIARVYQELCDSLAAGRMFSSSRQ